MTLTSCQAAVGTLAHSIGVLSEEAAWRASLGAVLSRMAAAVPAAEAAGAGGAEWGRPLVEALLAGRVLLPTELWGVLAARLA